MYDLANATKVRNMNAYLTEGGRMAVVTLLVDHETRLLVIPRTVLEGFCKFATEQLERQPLHVRPQSDQ
jgi:hypothetical protein